MKLTKIILRDNNVPASLKLSVVVTALGYGKIYELLHKQIWRKAPYRILRYANPLHTHHNGRPVEFILGWNIKSPQTGPYSYAGGDHTFGLNQLLMGQDFRKPYVGNPKDGIYHDDCYIEPKHIAASIDGYYDVFAYYTDSFIDYEQNLGTSYVISQTVDKQDVKGKVLINNVSLVEYTITAEPIAPATVGVTTHYKKIVIDKVVGDDDVIELGSYDPLLPKTDGILKGKTDSISGKFGYRKWMDNDKDEFTEHGNIVTQINTQPIFSLATLSTLSGWIRVYADGTVIEWVPESTELMVDDYGIAPSYYKILPMIYTDTGDLVMDRVEFVEKWNDYFELYVHEDKEWWTELIRPISLIVAAVIIYFSWGTLSPLAKAIVVIGYVIYAAGVLTNNTNMMLIGGIMMAGVSIYTAVESAYTTTVTTTQLSTISTEQALAGTSFQSTFEGYASAAGMGNLLVMPTVESYTSLTLEGVATSTVPYAELGTQAGMTAADYLTTSSLNINSLMTAGKELYSVYNNTNQLLNGSGSTSASTSATSDDKGMRITIKSSDEDDDVMRLIDKIIAL